MNLYIPSNNSLTCMHWHRLMVKSLHFLIGWIWLRIPFLHPYSFKSTTQISHVFRQQNNALDTQCTRQFIIFNWTMWLSIKAIIWCAPAATPLTICFYCTIRPSNWLTSAWKTFAPATAITSTRLPLVQLCTQISRHLLPTHILQKNLALKHLTIGAGRATPKSIGPDPWFIGSTWPNPLDQTTNPNGISLILLWEVSIT